MIITRFKTLQNSSTAYVVTFLLLLFLIACGLWAARYMDISGHHVSGMNNQIVWGLPHVFAIFLIVTASGALNIASISSVFGKDSYKPLARLSALLAIVLLVGGLVILVLDLGRPERLIVAMTHYNFKSIFAWNIILYTGFVVLLVIYLWTMFERHRNNLIRKVGIFALLWRIILTTGTGSIFGFLVARQAFDSTIVAPLFIVLSLMLGTAVFLLVMFILGHWSELYAKEVIAKRLGELLGIFIVASLCLTVIYHTTNLYNAQHYEFERFILSNGGIYTTLFWWVQIGLGVVLPLVLLNRSRRSFSVRLLSVVSLLVIAGGFAQLYVFIIAGQAFPMSLFPGKDVVSSFYDGVVAHYSPSWLEFALGAGGVAVSLLLLLLILRVMPFLPDNPMTKNIPK